MASKPTSECIRRGWVAHGSNWARFEDLLIGDRDGLVALRQAIDVALTKGEGSLSEIDSEYLAVRVVDVHPDQDRAAESWRSRIGTLATVGFFLFLLGCLIYGCIRLPDLFK
jgi:hypothetical protein